MVSVWSNDKRSPRSCRISSHPSDKRFQLHCNIQLRRHVSPVQKQSKKKTLSHSNPRFFSRHRPNQSITSIHLHSNPLIGPSFWSNWPNPTTNVYVFYIKVIWVFHFPNVGHGRFSFCHHWRRTRGSLRLGPWLDSSYDPEEVPDLGEQGAVARRRVI
jgi:hypothetical protein